MDSSLVYSETIKNVLLFKFYDDEINKRQRFGPKNYPAIRFIASGEIIDLEGEIIELQAIIDVMPIMLKQGGRIQSFHINHPGGEFFDWGITKHKGVDSIWVDVEVYTDYDSQRENLRRIQLPEGHKERINGLSLGGFKLAKQKECNVIRCWTRITKIEGWEFSFVDNMANQLAENIEDKMHDMEFVSLMQKEQPRDETGRFSKNEPLISSIITTTTTNFDNQEPDVITKTSESCPCGKHIDKGENPKDKKKPEEQPEEQPEEKTGVEEAIEGEEEIEEALDDEEEEIEGNLEGEEEFLPENGPEESATAERNIAVENNEMLRLLLTALNIEKGEVSAERLKELLAALMKKEDPKMDTEEKPIEIGGKKYIKKGDDFIPFVDENIVEIEGKKYIKKGDNFEPYEEATTVEGGLGLTADEVASIVTKSLEPFATQLAKLEIKKEEVTSETDDPSSIQKEAPIISTGEMFYGEDASNASVEGRLGQVHRMRKN